MEFLLCFLRCVFSVTDRRCCASDSSKGLKLSQKIPLKVLWAYSGPAAPLATLYFPIYIFLADFYISNFDLELKEVGFIFLFVRLFDAFSDPMMGVISDRVKAPLGRRRFWLLIGTPLVVCSAVALFWPNSSTALGSSYLAAWLIILTVGWTIIMTPYFALGAEISKSYFERSRITLYREAVALSGTILAAVLYSLGKSDFQGMKYIAIFVVVMLPVTTLTCAYNVKENVEQDRLPESYDILGVFLTFKSEPMFVRLLIAYFINGAANALPAALFVFFVDHKLEAPHLAGPFLLIYFFSAIIATPLWVKLSKRFEKHRLWCYTMIYASVVFSSIAFISAGNLIGFFFVCLLGGSALSADLAIPSSIQADLIDLQELRSGKRRTGTFFSFWSIATKGSVALSSGLALLILSYFNFDVTGNNTEKSLWILTTLYGFLPILLKICSIGLMWNFKLTKSYHHSIQQSLIRNP